MDFEMKAGQDTETELPAAPEPQKMPTLWVVILCVTGFLLAAAATVLGILQMRSDMAPKITDKDFTVNGLCVTLDDRFAVYEDSVNVVTSEEYHFSAIRVPFGLVGENAREMTAHDYLDQARGVNHVAAGEIRTAGNGVEYFTFTDSFEEGYHYFVFALKGTDNFYLGQFFCAEDVHPDTRDAQFAAWAGTAREIAEEPSSGT